MSIILDQQFEERVPLAQLKRHPENPRRGDVPAIALSIQQNGFYGAVIVQRSTGYILAGNHRADAAEREGLDALPVFWLSCTDEEARRILLVDNATNDAAGYDNQALAELLARVNAETGTLEGTGYDQESFDRILAQHNEQIARLLAEHNLTDPDAAPELPQTPVSVTADLWVLGSHKLLVGDATKLADAQRLMSGEMADLIFTDPPYNIDYQGYTKERLKICGDRMTDAAFRLFLNSAFRSYRAIVKPNASMYLFHPSSLQREFQDAIETAGFEVRCQIIWAKNTFAWGFGRYKFAHEPLFYCHVVGKKDRWYGDKSQSTLWEEHKPAANKLHPTMKPVALVERALVNSSRANDVVADFFGGAGSTLIGCQRLGRAARLIEIDPKYADVIIRRWQEFTGKRATLDGTTLSFDEAASERLRVAA